MTLTGKLTRGTSEPVDVTFTFEGLTATATFDPALATDDTIELTLSKGYALPDPIDAVHNGATSISITVSEDESKTEPTTGSIVVVA